jgi:hypothetical protein
MLLDGEGFILQVQRVFTRIRSGAAAVALFPELSSLRVALGRRLPRVELALPRVHLAPGEDPVPRGGLPCHH